MSESGKSKKKDKRRKSPQNLRYIAEHRHEKSHVRRINKHFKRYGGDTIDMSAIKALARYKMEAGLR